MNISPQSYRYLVPALLPVAALYLLWRARKQPSYLKHWGERFAWSEFPKPREVLQMAPDRIRQCFLPYDAVFAVRKFLRQTEPVMGLLMETEVWPTVLEEAHALGIPVALVNARLSEKSFNQAMRVPDLMKKAMSRFSAVCAQADSDAKRLRAMGTVEPVVTGSLKFDIQAPQSALILASEWKKTIKEPVVMFASTRDGEEALIVEALKKEARNDVRYLLVPRHPQRFGEVEELVKSAALPYQKRSALSQASDLREETRVILGDSMGEMFFYCALADVTLMGGSFKAFGCQNVIEPASVGVPVIVGPSTFNFSMVVEKGIESGAICQVQSVSEGIQTAHTWLESPAKLEHLKECAKVFSQSYVGATARTMKVLETLCKQS